MFFTLVFIVCSFNDVDQWIDELSKDEATSKRALEKLYDAGENAFPELLKRIDDQSIANSKTILNEFANSKSDLLNNHWDPKPTVGNVCFLIIRNQLEGGKPYSPNMRHTITKDNVRTLLTTSSTLRLGSMQQNINRGMIKEMCERIAKRGMSEHYLNELKHLLDRRELIKKSLFPTHNPRQLQLQMLERILKESPPRDKR